MNGVQIFIERLRPLVGVKCWDYCVVWKLSDDQRCIEWMGCCCGGAESVQRGEEEHHFPVSQIVACRDRMFQHRRTKPCDELAELPSVIPLDSGTHTQALISNQPRWLNLSNRSDSGISDEMVTRVLIPVAGGLVELFVAKHVPEDQQVIDLVMGQCNNPSWNTNTDPSFQDQPLGGSDVFLPENSADGHHLRPFSTSDYSLKTTNMQFQPWISPQTENTSLPWDLPLNHLGNQQLESIMFEKSTPSFFNPDNDFADQMGVLQQSMRTNSTSNLHQTLPQSSFSKEHSGNDKETVKQEIGRGDSISDYSDQIEEDEEQKVCRRTGRRHHSKNLMAERKRRKKLNDRLYALRALVPNITKMDRASILGDAIEFVKELQKQEKELQDELNETPEEEGGKQDNITGNFEQVMTQNMEEEKSADQGSSIPTDDIAKNQDCIPTDDTGQQMEVQVEVSQVDGNKLFLMVSCEHKLGGFVRLMEAMDTLGLEVINANVTTFHNLALNVFKVERRDNEVVQADQVKASLLELTQNPTGGLQLMVAETTIEKGATTADYHHNHHHHNHLHHHHH